MSCIGLDFGNQNSVIAVARRGGIDVIANEVSNRATPSMVGFQGEQRNIGEAAANFAMQNFKNTCTDLKSVLSCEMSSPDGQAQLKWLKNTVVENEAGFIAASCIYGKNEETIVFSYEAVTGALLSKLMQTAALENKTDIAECVLSVPGYYSDRKRRALLDAGSIGNVKILRLLNEHAAIALTYGIFRTRELPEKDPLKVAFVDIGQQKTTVCIADCLQSGVKILSVAHNEFLGGRDWDDLLVQHFAAEFKEKFKVDALSSAKATLRLRKDCEKLKKVLSANARAPISIECFMNDVDVRGEMMRDDYQEMMQPLLDRLKTVCKEAISSAKISDVTKIKAVEIVGGGCRIPAVKSAIENCFGQSLRTTLNADEAVARGCALMCAMLSPTFRVKDYAVNDCFGRALSVSRCAESDMVEGDDIPLLAKFGSFPCVKAVSLKNIGPCKLTLKHDKTFSIADYTIEAKPTDPEEGTKLRVKVKIDGNGVCEVVTAALQTEEEVEVPVEAEPPAPLATKKKSSSEKTTAEGGEEKTSTNAQAPEGSGAAEAPASAEAPPTARTTATPQKAETAAAGEATAVAEGEQKTDEVMAPAPEEAPKTKKVKKTKSVDVTIKRGSIGLGLTPTELQAAIDAEAEMKATDLYLVERSDALNALESFVYDTRSKLDDYGDLKDFAPAETRQAILQQLNAAEDWIYSDEGEASAKSMFHEKTTQLKAQVAPIVARRREFENRPDAVNRLREYTIMAKETVMVSDERTAHITDEEKQTVVKACEEAALWLTKALHEQNALSKEADPTLTVGMLSAKKEELMAVCKPILEKPVPKVEPPKAEEEIADMAVDEKSPTADGTAPASAPTAQAPAGAENPPAEAVETGTAGKTAEDQDMSVENGEEATPTEAP